MGAEDQESPSALWRSLTVQTLGKGALGEPPGPDTPTPVGRPSTSLPTSTPLPIIQAEGLLLPRDGSVSHQRKKAALKRSPFWFPVRLLFLRERRAIPRVLFQSGEALAYRVDRDHLLQHADLLKKGGGSGKGWGALAKKGQWGKQEIRRCCLPMYLSPWLVLNVLIRLVSRHNPKRCSAVDKHQSNKLLSQCRALDPPKVPPKSSASSLSFTGGQITLEVGGANGRPFHSAVPPPGKMLLAGRQQE